MRQGVEDINQHEVQGGDQSEAREGLKQHNLRRHLFSGVLVQLY